MPSAIDAAVAFTNDITANATITMTSAKTVGSMLIGDSLGTANFSWYFSPAAAQVLTLQASSGAASIVVTNGVIGAAGAGVGHRFSDLQALNLGSDLVISVVPGSSFGLRRTTTSVAGKSLTINGGGQVLLEANNNANTGNLLVNGSSIRLTSNGQAVQDPNLLLFGGNLLLNNAIVMHQGTFARPIGTGSGQVQFAGTSAGFCARSAGNGANDGISYVNLNNNGSTLQAGSAAMPTTMFRFNTNLTGLAPDLPLNVRNSLDLNGNTVTITAGPTNGSDVVNGVTISGASGITGTGNLVISGGTFLKVLNGLNHTGTTTLNGTYLLTPTVPAGSIVFQNNGVLHTAGLFNRTLGTGAGQLDIGTTGPGLGAYAGNLVVQLNGGTGTLNASTINSLLTLNAPAATGQVDFQNPININTATLTINTSQGGNACTAPSGNYGTSYAVVAPLSGTGGLTVTGGSGGMVVLNDPSTYAGPTTVDGGALTAPAHSVTLFGREGKGLTAANLTLKNGGILGTSGTFTRGIGTGANQVQWAATTRGGFAAVGGDLAVRLNNGAGAITMGAANTFGSLVLGSEFSTHSVDFQNDLITGSTLRGIAVAGSVEQKISGNISGAGGIQILAGSFGTLLLSGNNSFGVLDFAVASDNNVLLKLGSPTALGNITSFTYYRGTMDLNGYTVNGVNLTTSNRGNPNGQGYLQNSSATEAVWGGNLTYGYSSTLFSGRGNVRMNGNVGSSANATSPSKVGMGKLTLAGTAGAAGTANMSFTATGGELVLDYSANNTDKLPSTGTGLMTLSACALTVLGNGSATTAATVPALASGIGQNAITVRSGTNQNATLALNNCTRAGGGTIDFSLVNAGTGIASTTVTNTTLHNGLLRNGATASSGYATFNGGRTWATVVGGSIAGFSAFDAFGTASGNIDLSGSQNVSASIAYNTLRFNGGESTLTIDTTRTLTLGTVIGGILMTPDATGKATVARAGTGVLTAPADFVVHQYNTTYDLEISTLMSYVNNGALTKVGPGTLYMSNNSNTTDGLVYILGGTLRTDSINAITGQGSSGIGRGNYTTTTPRYITLAGGGRLLYTGSGHATDRAFRLNGDGTIDASGSGTLTLNANPNMSGCSLILAGSPFNLTLQGSGVGAFNGIVRLGDVGVAYGGFLAGTLIKTGAGTWTLNGEENIVQDVDVREGTFNLGHASNTLVDNARATVSNGATLGVGSNSEKLGVVWLKNGSITGTGTLQGCRYDVESGTISPVLGGVVSALTKTTGGTVTLTGANTYLGDTWVKAGTLVSTTRLAGNVLVDGGATLQAKGTVGGDLTLNGSFQVDASTPGTLAVGGAINLSGACVVSGGTQPFTITGTSRTGTFASVTSPLKAVYTPTSVTIQSEGALLIMIR